MVLSLKVVTLGNMCMMASGFMVALLMLFGSFLMMFGRMLMMLGRIFMMLCCFVFSHLQALSYTSCCRSRAVRRRKLTWRRNIARKQAFDCIRAIVWAGSRVSRCVSFQPAIGGHKEESAPEPRLL